jgi:HD-like signal output (HDOD) protein
LHDIGKLVRHHSNPAAFATLGVFDEEAERRRFGTTHADIGGRLAEKWGLEAEIVAGIQGHHDAAGSPLAVCVAKADRIATELGYGSLASGACDGAPGELDAELEAAAERVRTQFEGERHLFD